MGWFCIENTKREQITAKHIAFLASDSSFIIGTYLFDDEGMLYLCNQNTEW